ncbi:MAG: ABC transporter ATP-binding protein [Acidobacteria bacterium]|nr:ABC transporter ATP-binding protein [Acidobacteriota bacterium]
MIIQTENLTVQYGMLQALKSVNLLVQGGAVGLLGPNGAGKTTLLKTLLGFQDATSGSAKVLGLDIEHSQMEIRRRVGYMPEMETYIPGMSGIGMVTYMGQLSGMTRTDAMQRAHEMLFYVGLGEARYRDVQTYSTGMKQRVKLASALVHDPDILLLDEPTNGMDPDGRSDMLALVYDLANDRGKNVLFCSHLLQDVEEVCKDIQVLNEGELRISGDLRELKQEAGNVYKLKVAGDILAFVEALRLKRCEVEVEGRNLKVWLPQNTPLQRLFEIAYQRKIQIRHLAPSEKTLEEIFMNAVKKNGEVANADI